MDKMQMICAETVGKEVTIDSNDLYGYIGFMPAHTKISQKDLLTIFKCVLFLNKQNDEDKGNQAHLRLKIFSKKKKKVLTILISYDIIYM